MIQSVEYLIPVKFARILFSVEAQKSNISRKARYIFFFVFYSLGQSEFKAAIFVFRSARQEKKNKTKMCNRASTFCSTCFLSRTTHDHKNSVPVRHTLQPLCDLSATDNFHRSQRSQQGPRSVPARLQRSRRLIGDLVATKSVAARFLCLHKNLAATDLVADRSRQSRQPVPDQSPTSRRPIAD